MFDENEYTVVGLSDEELHTAFLSKEYKPFSNQDIVFKEYYDRDGMKTILGRILFGKSYDSEDIYNFLNKFSPSFAEKYKMTLNYVDPVEQKLNYKCKKEDSPDGISNKCPENKSITDDIDSKISNFMKNGSESYKNKYNRDDATPTVKLVGLNDNIKRNILDVLPDLEKTSKDLDIPMIRGIEAKPANSGMFGSANAFFGKINLSSSAIMGEYRSRSKKDKLSDWKLGDDIKNRPNFAVDYVDKNNMMKYYMYHEFAHHIHQTYGHQSGDTFNTGINPLEKEIETAYNNEETASASEYADSNYFEWFAENYALHKVGRDDLVTPEAYNLISKIEKNQKLNSVAYDPNTILKLNYKCKKEDSPDGNSNKCPDNEKIGHWKGSYLDKNTIEKAFNPRSSSIQESKSWVLSKVSPEPKIGKLLSMSLTDNAMHFINDAKVTYANIGTPGAVGLTKHGDIGPIINAGSNYSVTLHELGHAIQYPSVGSDGKFVYSSISTLDQDLVEPMKSDIKLGNKMPYMDTSSPGEFFADAFKHYNNPRTFLLFKESYPKTYNEMRKVFGKSKFDIDVDDETREFIRSAAKYDWIGSYKKYVANGYNGKQIEKIQDILSPNGDISQEEITTYDKRISMIKKELEKSKSIKKNSSFVEDDLPSLIKLNYKCKKEDSPDGMSNKCNDNKVLSEEDSKVRVSKKSITMDDKKSSSAYVPSKNVKDAEKFAYDNIIDQKSRKHAEEWNSGSIAHTTPDKVQQIKLVSYRGLDIHVSNIINKQLIENSLLNLPRPTSIIATQLRKEPNTLMRIGSSGKLEINTIAVGNFKKIDTSLDAGRKLNGKVGQDAMKFLGEHVATMTEKQKRQYEDIKECMKYSRACVGYEDDSNPERALTATINHEIAHMLDRYGKYGYDTPQHEEFKQIKRDMINTTLNSDYKYKLSSYGCKESGIFRQINKEETWAELYSAYRFHEDENIHPDVLRLLKKYLPER